MKSIDLNCDMGEVPEHISDGTQEALMHSITSVNIACGGHAGDEQTMKTTIEQALRYKLAIGAHPGRGRSAVPRKHHPRETARRALQPSRPQLPTRTGNCLRSGALVTARRT